MRSIRGARLVIATVLAVSADLSAQTPRGGHVIGRTVDSEGAALPGVTVTVAGNGLRRQSVSGVDGRFDVASVPAGVYQIAVALPGFEGETRQVTLTTPDSVVDLSLRLKVGQSCYVDYVDLGFQENVRKVDAILHVRILTVEPDESLAKKGCTYDAVTYTASVIDILKSPAQIVQPSTIRWGQDSGQDESLGQEYVVFLSRSDSRYHAGNGQYVFPIRDRRADLLGRDVPGVRDGDSVDQLTAAMRAVLSGQ